MATCTIPVLLHIKQEAQLSQRDRAMLHVTEYFANSLKVIQMTLLHRACVSAISISISTSVTLCLYVVPFSRYSASKNGVTLKPDCGFLFAFHSNYDSILHHLRYKARYLSKIVIISNPLVFGDPVQEVPVGISPSRLV